MGEILHQRTKTQVALDLTQTNIFLQQGSIDVVPHKVVLLDGEDLEFLNSFINIILAFLW